MEWTSIDGIFNQFYNLFDEYNSTIKDNVEILNLTPDNDLYEEISLSTCVGKRISLGGTSVGSVEYQIKKIKEQL